MHLFQMHELGQYNQISGRMLWYWAKTCLFSYFTILNNKVRQWKGWWTHLVIQCLTCRNEYTPGIMSSICTFVLTNVDYLHQTLIYHSFCYTWCLSGIKCTALLEFFSAEVIIDRSPFPYMSISLRILLNNFWQSKIHYIDEIVIKLFSLD